MGKGELSSISSIPSHHEPPLTHSSLRLSDAPWYVTGHAVVLAFIGIGFVCSFVHLPLSSNSSSSKLTPSLTSHNSTTSLLYMILLKRENAKRDRGERNEIIVGPFVPSLLAVPSVFQTDTPRADIHPVLIRYPGRVRPTVSPLSTPCLKPNKSWATNTASSVTFFEHFRRNLCISSFVPISLQFVVAYMIRST